MKTIFVGLGTAIAALGLSACTTQSSEASNPIDDAFLAQDAPGREARVIVVAEGANVEEEMEDPMVCRRQAISGSRLQKRRVCARQSEWDALREDTQKNVDDILRQTTAGILNPGG
ncbi:MAG: hypothetical protein AAGJ50_04350 [Pseudomonadota bacterium]